MKFLGIIVVGFNIIDQLLIFWLVSYAGEKIGIQLSCAVLLLAYGDHWYT
jgi:hypothetical protein